MIVCTYDAVAKASSSDLAAANSTAKYDILLKKDV